MMCSEGNLPAGSVRYFCAVPTRVFNAQSLTDPRDIISVGGVAVGTKQLTQCLSTAPAPAVRHERIDMVIELIALRCMYGPRPHRAPPRLSCRHYPVLPARTGKPARAEVGFAERGGDQRVNKIPDRALDHTGKHDANDDAHGQVNQVAAQDKLAEFCNQIAHDFPFTRREQRLAPSVQVWFPLSGE
jgi:hypothetical protein